MIYLLLLIALIVIIIGRENAKALGYTLIFLFMMIVVIGLIGLLL